MAPKNKIIIDTDPGVDDVLALLLALSASPEDLEVAMISVTYGNVELQNCLRNVVALFHVLEKETEWRKSKGKPEGFESLKCFKPVVAIGAEHPLEDEILMADHFHGVDGLHGVHAEHPNLTPADTWRELFVDGELDSSKIPSYSRFFTPSKQRAHMEMLRILRENPEDTISIVAVGPMTNIALAAAEDPETFLRVKELVVMGGAIGVPGNITPVAEFNTYADSVASARVFALSSPTPKSTMPAIPENISTLPPYPEKLSKTLKLALLPLDITTPHLLMKTFLVEKMSPLMQEGSPLAVWTNTFLSRTMDKIESMEGNGEEPGLSLHDPLCVWYMILRDHPAWKSTPKPEDIRIETSGQWTRGMHVVDSRIRAKLGEKEGAQVNPAPEDPMQTIALDEDPGDTMGWLSLKRGNRINRIIQTPGEELFAKELMKSVFG
ncbi:hypothetical protein MKZ38_003095 [Zalerion maritima]|uniref:Inosine/uridine-preferring nucleoside hydrolase domain-containing protein n=1 Tax=Zalerion maritima TaxID=339359 RepID=A0AAD5RXW4_9PEZI|nr:hypothetical protein MKZ38_003095 [Zalerion maritima]